jgi:hypothetical protein
MTRLVFRCGDDFWHQDVEDSAVMETIWSVTSRPGNRLVSATSLPETKRPA